MENQKAMTMPENFTHEIKDLDLERFSDSVISPSLNGFFTKKDLCFILWPDAHNT
jgi:predicted KAP-like P-loop ATPase